MGYGKAGGLKCVWMATFSVKSAQEKIKHFMLRENFYFLFKEAFTDQ